MTTYDLSPLFRSTIGFDHLSQLIDSAFKADERMVNYPPYNIAKLSEDEYEITMAVAGFKLPELDVVVEKNILTVTGSSVEKTEEKEKAYLHRGIATRSFERKFSLADHVKIASASLSDGMLTLKLLREIPEASKPKKIAISDQPAANVPLIEGKMAAKKVA